MLEHEILNSSTRWCETEGNERVNVGARILWTRRLVYPGMNGIFRLKISWCGESSRSVNWKAFLPKDSGGLRLEQLETREPVEAAFRKAANSTELRVTVCETDRGYL